MEALLFMLGRMSSDAQFFATPADLRAWFEAHHQAEPVLLVGYYKVGSGRPSVTWPQSVDQALCFGWIDGVRRSIDADSYCIRFTPRKARSYWSSVNLKKFAELLEAGLVAPAGLAAFEARAGEAQTAYSFEQEGEIALTAEQQALFESNPEAWRWFQNAAPWYRKASIWWVISARQEATKLRRLQRLIDASAAGEDVPPLKRPESKAD